MDPTYQILVGGLMMAGMMLGLWALQWRWSDASIVDVGWSAGIGILALFYAVTTPDGDWLPAILGALWSLRLATYLLLNRIIGKPEDGRYVALRKRFGDGANRFFFVFFQVQALLDVIFSLPILVAIWHRQMQPFWMGLGCLIWFLAVGGEMLADWQLARFRRDPASRGKVCDTGLWRYSRHPNYFFEWLHWWTYVVFAIGSSWWWVTLIGPILMLLFLLFVTGVRATEEHLLQSRGEAYRRYQARTSPFVPWFPRKDPIE